MKQFFMAAAVVLTVAAQVARADEDIAPSLLNVPVAHRATLIRGTAIELPFQIKILLHSFSLSSAQAEKGFEIVGHELMGKNDKAYQTDRIRCRKLSSFTQLLFKDLRAPKESFLCDAGRAKIVINEKGLRIAPRAGFLNIDKKIYRGELFLKKEGDEIFVVNAIPLDPYLAGLANKEMGKQFPDEAIKAQLIAARSYAIATLAERRSRNSFYDLKSTEADQVYSGFIPEDSRTYRLARQTSGQVLFHQEQVLKAFYHSSNGGFSEMPSTVWGTSVLADELAYLARKSPFDAKMETNRWQVFISPRMGETWNGLGEISEIKVLERTSGLRVKKLKITGVGRSEEITGAEFRSRFGNRWIKSTLFSVKKSGSGWMIDGRGWGHGVGLSQYGAKAMADAGLSAEKILQFYYPNANLRTLDLDGVEAPVDNLLAPVAQDRAPAAEAVQAR